MSGTYEIVNRFSSFGFSRRRRKEFVEEADVGPGTLVCDLMCGMGELWGYISGGMPQRAEKRRHSFPSLGIALHEQNTLNGGSADRVVRGFGVKTLS